MSPPHPATGSCMSTECPAENDTLPARPKKRTFPTTTVVEQRLPLRKAFRLVQLSPQKKKSLSEFAARLRVVEQRLPLRKAFGLVQLSPTKEALSEFVARLRVVEQRLPLRKAFGLVQLSPQQKKSLSEFAAR
jgi:hypothetical protein